MLLINTKDKTKTMDTVKIQDKEFKMFLSQREIEDKIEKMAHDLSMEMKGKKPVFITVLKGAVIFASQFIKNYRGDCQIDFVRLSSYSGTHSTGEVKQLWGNTIELEARDVVVLEDIIDTGVTLKEIHKIFQQKKVNSIKTVALFFKPQAYKGDYKIDHIGFSIPNKFIVGYGLDYNEMGRNLPNVYEINN